MLEQPSADRKNSFQVNTKPIAQIGSLTALAFTIASLCCAIAHAYLPLLISISFTALSAYSVLSSGNYVINDEALEYKNPLGRWRFYWCDLSAIEVSTMGSILLLGSNQRFIITSFEYVAGEQKKPAWEFIAKKLDDSKITPKQNRSGDYLWNKNCRVR